MPRKPDFTGYDTICIEFLSSQNTGTRHTYKSFLRHILKFTEMTGQQILDSKKTDKNNEWEKRVIAFKQWMKTQKTKQGRYYSDNAINTAVNTLRSFFDYYRTPFLFSQNEKRKLNGKAKRVTKDYMLTNEDISKMALVGNLREKYIILLGKSFGLRAGDFIGLTYGRFSGLNLDQEAPIFIGDFQTEKEGVTAYPFIDSDALPIIKLILDGNRDKPNNERILTFQGEELSSILQKLAIKANINLGDQHLRFHCFRKYLSDRLSANMSESKWKQIVGKAISEGAYISNFELRDSYLKTMKMTTVSSNGNVKVSKLSGQLTALSRIVKEQSEELEDNSEKMEALKSQYETKINEQEDRLKRIENKLFSNQPWLEWERYLSDHPDESEQFERQFEEREKWDKEHPEEVKEQREQLEKRIEEYEEWQDKYPEVREQEEKMFREHDQERLAELEDKMIDILKLLGKDKGTEKN